MTQEHYLSILKGAGIAAGGALLTYLLAQVPNIHYGQYTPVITAVFSILINAGLKWLDSQKTPSITLDSLPNEPSQIK